jgi:hypothetical protein
MTKPQIVKMLSAPVTIWAAIVLTVQGEVHRLGEYERQGPWPTEQLLPELQRLIVKYNTQIAQADEIQQQAFNDSKKSQEHAEKVGAVSNAAHRKNDQSLLESLQYGSHRRPDVPPGFPAQLAGSRRALYDDEMQKWTAVHRAFAGAESSLRKALDAMATGQARNNAALLQQIAQLKSKLAEYSLPDSAPATVKRQKGLMCDGGFDFGGWDWRIYATSKSAKIVRDGADPVLRLREKGTGEREDPVMQQIRIPRQAKSATVSGRIRGNTSNSLDAKKPNSGAMIVARTVTKGVPNETALLGGRTATWQVFSKVIPLDSPRDVADEMFTIELKIQSATGDFYFDDITVEFR